MGTDALDPSITCASAPRLRSPLRRRLGSYCQSRLDPNNPADLFPVRACPVVLGCSAFGAAVYELQPPPETVNYTTWPVKRVWAREDVSCGTSIPLVSMHPESAIVYCSGLKQGRYVGGCWLVFVGCDGKGMVIYTYTALTHLSALTPTATSGRSWGWTWRRAKTARTCSSTNGTSP